MIKAVIFDLWNTLAYNDGKIDFLKYKKDVDIRRIEKAIMIKRFDTKQEAVGALLDVLGHKRHSRVFESVVAMFLSVGTNTKLFDDVVPVLTDLKRDYKLALISNTNGFAADELTKYGLYDLFDELSLSCDVGLLKPDKRIFELTLRKLGVEPEEAVMVGDNYGDDVAGAKNVGMDAILLKRKTTHQLMHLESKGYDKTISSLNELRGMIDG